MLIHAKLATHQSWDYRAKQGFYIGPALDYRCYELVKSETKQKVISKMVEFRHTYLQIPVVLADDKIINVLQVMAGVFAVPSREVRRLRGRSHLRLIWSARQPAILSSNAERNRS